MTVRLALSSAQTGVWVAQQLDPDDRSFNIAEYCDIEGPVDRALFETALREVVAATPALRARFGLGEEGLCQDIDDTVDVPLLYEDVSAEPDPRAAAERRMRLDLTRAYDLAAGPLFTWALFKAGPARYFWYRAAHHAVVDGFGLSLVAAHVADVYTALATGRPRRPRPPGTLAEAVAADSAYQESPEFEADRRYWLARMAGHTEVASLADRQPPPTRTFVRHAGHLGPGDVDALRAAARRLEVTWPEVVLAAVAVQLHRATGVREVVLGLPVTGRTGPMLRRVPAMLTNTVPLRVTVTPDRTFAEVVADLSVRLEEAVTHQRYPQERLVRELPGLPDGRKQFGPDVNIMSFGFGSGYAGHPATVHNLAAGPVEDLTVNVYDRLDGQGLQVSFDGNDGLYDRTDLAGHLDAFLGLLRSVPDLLEGRALGPAAAR
ncbi:dimodular nonribosomal peptide synthase [Streptomyces sp. CB02923]|uniref:condensation domain-containing protein n=1 Tax=Streptomyces sp. CB02923 TaxID=1718985 RepID=UPI00093C103D|nr:condensation domain-containing protein [Streptomyces sp. CB02923]OKI09481.1 dimodular nonribosomal peptide synthase [Streptomyces sp. CB02923]